LTPPVWVGDRRDRCFPARNIFGKCFEAISGYNVIRVKRFRLYIYVTINAITYSDRFRRQFGGLCDRWRQVSRLTGAA